MTKNSVDSFWNEFAHEVRNSLHIVIGSASLLKTDMAEEGEQLVNNIESSARQLQEMLNMYLTENRIGIGEEAGTTGLVLCDVVKDVVEQHKVLAKDKDLRIGYTCDDAVPIHLLGAKTKLVQILNNLVGNAIHYTQRGKVCIKYRLLASVGNEVRVRFSVEDTGPGISTEDQQKLFKKYSRLNPTSEDEGKRFGLGLSICRRLLQTEGSDISLKSEPGKGSIFEFDLSFKKHSGMNRSVPDEVKKMMSLKGNVLVVDDEHVNRKILSELLSQYGVENDVASSAHETLLHIESKVYSWVFLDVNLPDSTGWKLAKLLKSANADAKIVLTSGDVKELQDHKKLNGYGISAVLAKPFSKTDLLRVLNAG